MRSIRWDKDASGNIMKGDWRRGKEMFLLVLMRGLVESREVKKHRQLYYIVWT